MSKEKKNKNRRIEVAFFFDKHLPNFPHDLEKKLCTHYMRRGLFILLGPTVSNVRTLSRPRTTDRLRSFVSAKSLLYKQFYAT